jgi:hypothetical protein
MAKVFKFLINQIKNDFLLKILWREEFKLSAEVCPATPKNLQGS